MKLWEIFSLKKMIHDLLESHNFVKFGKKLYEKKLDQK